MLYRIKFVKRTKKTKEFRALAKRNNIPLPVDFEEEQKNSEKKQKANSEEEQKVNSEEILVPEKKPFWITEKRKKDIGIRLFYKSTITTKISSNL